MIVAQGLEKTYTSGGRPLPVLKSVDLEVAPKSFVAVVGPSGSGKTTLLGLLAGLDEPSGGQVYLDGTDVFALTEDDRAGFRAERVGFVFQTFHLLPTLTALENVLVPLELRGNARGLRDRAASLLEQVGLTKDFMGGLTMAFFRLLRAGLVKGSGDVCAFRCELYRMYFEDKL